MSFPTYHHSDLEDGEYSRSTSDEYQFDDPRDHILHVYSAVWSEFYRWEPDASRGVLTSLRRDRQGPVDLPFGDELQPEYACHLGLDNTEQDLCFSYDMAGGSSDIITFEGITAKPYLAHPPYEACTPVSRNIAWREGDYDDSQQCQFIPYADDPLFDSGRYLKHFSEGLAWDAVKNVCTPDVEMIQLETVRRLYLSQPSIPLDVIDESGVLPKLYPDSAAHLFSGFLWEVTQRDALAWPGASFSTLGSLEYTRACSEDDILSRVNSVIWHSCPNLNCVDPHCRTHNFAYPSLVPKRPTLNSINLYPTLAATCGPDCFLNIADFDIFQESVLWGEEDMRALQDILAIVPDSSPCDLAVICRKPCNEAFVQRCLIFPDETIYVPPSGLESEPEPLVFVEELDTYSRIAAIRPCSHDGPCNRRSKCPCWESQMRCQRNCRCDLECRRRFPGCDCKSSGPYTCESANFCPCARAGRECDPELCMPCFSKKGMFCMPA
ncbi:hypothetical protein OE88DRAFT_400504 [Heliocybe sulcata]|uniref:CXC domain-containing protein n=1 Tax=Heliocybe sulcata TaxID=5364 RepID=A0A5C3MWC0_9AGAM|nr:hypothetical protein OE88DRAFT_400504 [Heliocybe sulcata]